MLSKKNIAKSQAPLTQDAICRLGKHISPSKAVALITATTVTCLCPILLVFRFWQMVPVIIPTGLIGANGQDDSLPRWALFFAIPGLFCLLNFICHAQLWLNQRRMTLPPAPVRILGRWFFPIVSVLLSYHWILHTANDPVVICEYPPLILGLGMLLLGAQFLDIPRTSPIALHFSFVECSEEMWKRTHTLAAYCYLVIGILCIAGTMLYNQFTLIAYPVAAFGLLAPVVWAYISAAKKG